MGRAIRWERGPPPTNILLMAARPLPAKLKPLGFGPWYGLATLILASAAGNSVMQVMLLIAEPMKHELSISDAQIGALRGIGVTLVVAFASYPVSWLADRIDRRLIFSVCVAVWCLATALSGLASSYPMLFGCAMGIAVGEAVLGPVVFSLIPDLFPAERRIMANSIFFVAQVLGYGIGLSIGGVIMAAIDSSRHELPAAIAGLATWRLTLVAAALPGLALVPMVLAIPLRRRARAVDTTTPTTPRDEGVLSYLRAHPRTLFSLFIGFGAIGAANFTVFGWMSIAIVRLFGVSPAEVGLKLGQIFAIGSGVGVFAANALARWFAKRNAPAAPLRVAQVGALAAVSLSFLYLIASSPAQFYGIAVCQIAASFGGLALSPTATQNIAPARIRARLIAVGGLFYTIFGALSPLVVGLISDELGPAPRNLLVAMMIVAVPGFVGGAMLLRFAEKTLPSTLAAARSDDLVFDAAVS